MGAGRLSNSFCCAEVAGQLGIFPQLRIAVGGQHLAVGVHVDAGALRLLQQLVQILQIVAGHHNKGAAPHVGVDAGGGGVAEGGGVGSVQQRHALVIHQPELSDQRQPLLDGVFLPQGAQPLVKPQADLLVLVPQTEGVVGVGGHALHAEQQRGAQGHHVRVAPPQPVRLLHREPLLCQRFGAAGVFLQRLIVKIHVGQRGKQTVRQ